jgi:hypothetical protein
LQRLEESANQESRATQQSDLFSQTTPAELELDPLTEKAIALQKEIEAIQLDSLSPKDALDLLYQLKKI